MPRPTIVSQKNAGLVRPACLDIAHSKEVRLIDETSALFRINNAVNAAHTVLTARPR